MPDRDTVTIDLPVHSEAPLVLALAQKKQLKELSEKHLDLRTMIRPFNIANMPPNYEVLGEAAETVDALIDKHVVKKVNDLSGLLLSVHYTDLKTLSDSAGHLRVVLNLAHKNEENFLPGLELALYLADRIAAFKPSANAKAKALKSREVYNQSKEKVEMEKHKEDLKKKKEEKLRQEEAWLRSLPPEKQKKEEEKRKKKEFNKLLKGKTMKM
jgi:hypothetical protein